LWHHLLAKLESKFIILALARILIYSFTVLATVIMIVNYDHTVVMIINYVSKNFKNQATGVDFINILCA
jgi:hypothetical protein